MPTRTISKEELAAARARQAVPAIDGLTRLTVIELAEAGFRFVGLAEGEVVLAHDRYGELRLVNGPGKA